MESLRNSQSKIPPPISAKEPDGEADMVALCRAVGELANRALAAEGGWDAGGWPEIHAALAMVAARPARAPAGLAAKINLWRILAPSDVFAPDRQSLDEQLLVSIVADAARVRALNA